MLGDNKLAEHINKVRGGNDTIIIIENESFKYYKEEKVSFSSDLLYGLNRSLQQNYLELKIEKKKNSRNSNFVLINEKIYKNIYGAIKKAFCQKIDNICEKHKNELKRSILGSSNDELSPKELDLRQKIKDEFTNTYSDMNTNNDFYRIFPQTQIFSSYLDKYIENNK